MGIRAFESTNPNNPDGMSKFKKGDWVTPTETTDFFVNGEAYSIVNGDMGKVTWVCNNEVTVCFNDFMEATYYESQLEPYTPSDTDLTITLAKLREVLNEYSEEKNLMIDDFDTEEIIDRIKQELK